VDYWEAFSRPKIFYQDITWQPQFSLDTEGMLSNNTVYFLPTADLWLLGALNSPVSWWFAWRKAQHGKDEALRYFTKFVEAFPVPRPSEAQREQVEGCIRRLLEITDQRQQGVKGLLDWLQTEFELAKPSQRLATPTGLEEEAFVAEVRKLRGRSKPLSPAGLRALRDGFAESVLPLKQAAAEAMDLERRVSDCVNEAFGLTKEETDLVWKTAPPRMPVYPEVK
jgi:hypothetical protein